MYEEDQKTVQWTVFPTICQSFNPQKARSMRFRSRQASTRRAPGGFVGKSDSITEQARSESQDPADMLSLP